MSDSPEINLTNLAREEYERVNREVLQRRQCRSNVFITTLITLTTSGLAMIGFVNGFEGLESARPWLMVGVVIPLAVLTVAILVTIHKAGAINLRLGYLGALGKSEII